MNNLYRKCKDNSKDTIGCACPIVLVNCLINNMLPVPNSPMFSPL